MADPNHPDKPAAARSPAETGDPDLGEPEAFETDVAGEDFGVDPGGMDFDSEEALDNEEAEETPPPAELLAPTGELDEQISEDLGVDSIVGPLEAGLGAGLDQAEEALLGITDEEIAARAREIEAGRRALRKR